MCRINIPSLVWNRWSPTFSNLGNFLNVNFKIVLCLTWWNCCQFWEYFLTDRIFWATCPEHSQNRSFYHALILSTPVQGPVWLNAPSENISTHCRKWLVSSIWDIETHCYHHQCWYSCINFISSHQKCIDRSTKWG